MLECNFYPGSGGGPKRRLSHPITSLWDGNGGFDAAKHTWYCAGLMHSYAAASDAFLPALTTKPETLVNGAGLRAETSAWWSSGVRQWGKG
jgi:hypothetical protein